MSKQPAVPKKQIDFVDDKTAALLLRAPTSARWLLWLILLFLIIAGVWAAYAELDQVTRGAGKVIPSSRVQVVQNLEGGILEELLIKEGDQVIAGQTLLVIDDTRFQSDFRQQNQELVSAKADEIRLKALLNHIVINKGSRNWRNTVVIKSGAPDYSATFVQQNAELVKRQNAEFRDNISSIDSQLSVFAQQIGQKEQELVELRARLSNQQNSYAIANREYNITKPLAEEKIVPKVEMLKLERQLSETRREVTSTKLQIPVVEAALREAIQKRIEAAVKYRADIQAQLNQTSGQLNALQESQVGLQDKVERTAVLSPVAGTIQKIYTNTTGGVIKPGMDLIEIVPSEDSLVIEAKIAPKDIAFLRPGLKAMIKFSAYDFAIYGGLEGELEHISADTIQDEEGNSFYQVKIRTGEKGLYDKSGKLLPIIPGMTASTDILTGKRTVMQYLINPIINARHTALRE